MKWEKMDSRFRGNDIFDVLLTHIHILKRYLFIKKRRITYNFFTFYGVIFQKKLKNFNLHTVNKI